MATATWGLNSPKASSKLAWKLPWCPQTVGCKAEGLLLRGEGSEGPVTSSPKSPALLGQAQGGGLSPFSCPGRGWAPASLVTLYFLHFCPKAVRGEEESRSPWGACQFGEERLWASSNLGGRWGRVSGWALVVGTLGPETLRTPPFPVQTFSPHLACVIHTCTSLLGWLSRALNQTSLK